MIKQSIIAITLLIFVACAGSPSPQTAGQQTETVSSSPKSKRCVNGCTGDYSECVAQGRARGDDITGCEPAFRACVDDC